MYSWLSGENVNRYTELNKQVKECQCWRRFINGKFSLCIDLIRRSNLCGNSLSTLNSFNIDMGFDYDCFTLSFYIICIRIFLKKYNCYLPLTSRYSMWRATVVHKCDGTRIRRFIYIYIYIVWVASRASDSNYQL